MFTSIINMEQEGDTTVAEKDTAHAAAAKAAVGRLKAAERWPPKGRP